MEAGHAGSAVREKVNSRSARQQGKLRGREPIIIARARHDQKIKPIFFARVGARRNCLRLAPAGPHAIAHDPSNDKDIL
jgi:hypothetical protein